MNQEQQWRANTYSLLANLLSYSPDQNLLDSLATIAYQPEPNATPMTLAWNRLAVSAENTPVEKLAVEYQKLFIGVSRGEVLPYGSYYLSGFLMEKPLALLRDDLLKLGIHRQQNIHEPEDHLAALYEVMCILISDNPSRQKDFFQQHIAPWCARFFTDLQGADSANFYQIVAQLGTAFFNIEQNYFLAQHD